MVKVQFSDGNSIELKPSLYTMRLFKEKKGHDIHDYEKAFSGNDAFWSLVDFCKCALDATIDLDGLDVKYSEAQKIHAIGSMSIEDMQKVVQMTTDINFFKSILKAAESGKQEGTQTT